MSMVELQSCASLVNASSALRAIEQEVKGESVNVIAEISAELQREREKNSELMGRISILEAQIQEKNKESLVTDGQDSYINATDRRFKKFKRRKIETSIDRIDDGIVIKSKMASKAKHDTQSQCIPPTDANLDDRLVNWMSMDENQFLHFDKLKDGESAADCEDTDHSDEEDDDYYEEDNPNIDHKDREIDEKLTSANELKEHNHRDDFDKRICIPCSENFSSGHPTQITNEDIRKDCLLPDMKPDYPRRDIKKHDKKETKKIGGYRTPDELITSGSILMHKRPPKVPFCPREVKRILESEALSLKNAHTHTIRKIVVFSSLGIRHGCEDMYELDFNHFRILRKGESYVSAKNPGEHVLYENPGVRRKVFYPNRQNPILCPVQILEEEKAMRPSDPSCPSCLFLCIKYGGRTRNLPQNEYVRQRMGRNKLKSFGPCMCRMAALVHIRSGSFFFKALGITLLFMAGFPGDMVQMETKYRNLDLLQKYFRTDEVAEGEELFLLHPTTCNNIVSQFPTFLVSQQFSPGSQQLTGKMTLTKPKGKKQTNTTSKPHNLPGSSIQKSVPSSAAPPAQFGIMGYTSIQTHAMAALQSTQSQTPADTPPVSNTMITSSGTNIFYQNQNPYHMFPPQPANAFVPMMYWPPPSAFPPGPYPTTCSYQSFPFPANYMSIHPQQYYSHPSCNPFLPKMVENCGKNDVALEEADSDSDSSSSSTEPKEALACCKQ